MYPAEHNLPQDAQGGGRTETRPPENTWPTGEVERGPREGRIQFPPDAKKVRVEVHRLSFRREVSLNSRHADARSTERGVGQEEARVTRGVCPTPLTPGPGPGVRGETRPPAVLVPSRGQVPGSTEVGGWPWPAPRRRPLTAASPPGTATGGRGHSAGAGGRGPTVGLTGWRPWLCPAHLPGRRPGGRSAGVQDEGTAGHDVWPGTAPLARTLRPLPGFPRPRLLTHLFILL